MRWRLTDPSLVWRCWDGQTLVFHPASGDTHLVEPLAAAVLQSLQEAPRDAEDLFRLAAAQAACDPRAAAEPCAALLVELEALGLVEPVPT